MRACFDNSLLLKANRDLVTAEGRCATQQVTIRRCPHVITVRPVIASRYRTTVVTYVECFSRPERQQPGTATGYDPDRLV